MNNKSVADIVAEMRRHVELAREYPHDIEITTSDVEDWADRIEEADQSQPQGNAAKMRSALARVKRLFDGRLMFQPAIRESHDMVNEALTAKPRNCDKYTTPRDAAFAYADFVRRDLGLDEREAVPVPGQVLNWIYREADDGE